jgi:hypothetical protein
MKDIRRQIERQNTPADELPQPAPESTVRA